MHHNTKSFNRGSKFWAVKDFKGLLLYLCAEHVLLNIYIYILATILIDNIIFISGSIIPVLLRRVL